MNNLSYSRKFSDFYIETSDLVDQYFLNNQISKTGDLSLIFKAFSFFMVGSMVFIANLIISKSVINVLIFTLFTGLCIGILTTFTHESTHMVFAKEKWKNRLMTHFIDLMGACSLGYQINHSKHHNFTNIEGADTDIHFEPFIRLTSQQKRHWWHSFQHIYTPFLYSLSSLFLIWDMRGYALFKDKNMNSKLFFWLSKIFHIGVFLIIPILSLGFGLGLVTYFGIMLTSGLFLGLLNEPIHLFDGANFTKPNLLTNKIEQTWDQVVLTSSSNFSPNSKIINFFTAGLNFHLVHSLFPKISHIHYPKINQILVKQAKKHNLNYKQFPSYYDMLKSHLVFLKKMGLK